jgi:hypothetical protein
VGDANGLKCVETERERFRTRIIKWSRRRAGPPLHYNVYNIYIHVTHRPVCAAPQTGLRGVRPIVCARREREKKLNRNPPTPIPRRHRGPYYPSPIPLLSILARVTAFTLLNFCTEVNEQNESCVHTAYVYCVYMYVL